MDLEKEITIYKKMLKLFQYYIKIESITGFAITEEVQLNDGNKTYLFSVFFDGNKIELYNDDKEKSLEISNRFMEIYFN